MWGRAALEMTCGEGDGRFPNRPYGNYGAGDGFPPSETFA